jgi:hypothetical protein
VRSIALIVSATLLFTASATAQTDSAASKQAITHQALVERAFDRFEAVLFAPLSVDKRTPVAGVKAVCQSVQESLAQLVAYAETRKSLTPPDTLGEIQQLNQYLANRFHAIQAGLRQSGRRLQASSRIMETNCPELSANETVAQNAVNTVLAQYGPEGWCRAMTQRPQADWNVEDAGNFARICPGVKPN